mmetsp:Transcript_10306/g.18361  ORF Transcript_10306/g.18361 Transcript_10306/m.18361 type:complete len:418 (+) Transcript_10306:54-1307(+)
MRRLLTAKCGLTLALSQVLPVLAVLEVSDGGAKAGDVCGMGSRSTNNQMPKVDLCNCGTGTYCQSYASLDFLGAAVSWGEWPQADTFVNIQMADVMWPSRRYKMVKDNAPQSYRYGASEYTLISDGVAVGDLSSGVYTGISTYFAESEYPALLPARDFIVTTPQTFFSISEVERIAICHLPTEEEQMNASAMAALMAEQNQTSSNSSNATVEEPPEELSTCGKEQLVAPGRVKMGIYGYTFGGHWKSDIAGLRFLVLRLRLCFNGVRNWFVNGYDQGAGIVDGEDAQVRIVDFEQDNGRTLALWMKSYYMVGNHLNCSLRDTMWDMPKWECMHVMHFGKASVTATSAGKDQCSDEGIMLNVAFDAAELSVKDKWFYFELEVNTTTARAAAANFARRSHLSAFAMWISLLVMLLFHPH